VSRETACSRGLRLCATLFLASGCVSYGSHLTATPTAPDRREYSIAADALVLDRGFGPQVLPNPEASIRWGIARELDFGLRVNAIGAEASSRIGLVQAERYRLTTVPLLGGGLVTATNQDTDLVTTTAGVVLLNGFALGSRTDLVVGLRGQARLGLNAVAVQEDFAEASWSFEPGGALGVRFPVSERLYLFPEVVVVTPYALEGGGFKTPIVQGGVAVQWDSAGSRARAQPGPP
jgi:hypothetical protein